MVHSYYPQRWRQKGDIFMKIALLVLGMVVIAGSAWAGEGKSMSIPGMSGLDISGEFFSVAIRTVYDEQDKRPPITIPKKWKLVSVSNGESAGFNNLWFQDTDGTVYLLHGYIKNGQFTMDKTVQKIIAK